MEAVIPTDFSATPALVPFNVVVVLLILAGLVLLVAAVRLLRLRLRQGAEENRELPPLIYSPHRSNIHRPTAGRPAEEQVLFDSTAPPVRIVREPPAQAAAEPDPGATLQLLPGRLEPANPGNRQEIRFVRVGGSNRFTLGRESSTDLTHIRLEAATASRMHAFMLFDEGRWRLGNLSQTNQVVLNGARLNGDAPRLLEDGDRIEFGELTFVFRAR